MIRKIISGGQTGADMGGLLAGETLFLETGGWTTNGFVDENGCNYDLAPRFGLVEIGGKNKGLRERTVKNIIDSDGTVIFATDLNSAGTKLTINTCNEYAKPCIVCPTSLEFRRWISENDIEILNVAGNRESKSKDLCNRVRNFLQASLWKKSDIFVFGSNAKGKHGKGAAKFASDYCGAQYDNPRGLQGRSYAIVTKKDWTQPRSSSPQEILQEFEDFLEFAGNNLDKNFLVSELGMGNGGYHHTEISCILAPALKNVPENVFIPRRMLYNYSLNKMNINSVYGIYNSLDKQESDFVRNSHRIEFEQKHGMSADFSGSCQVMLDSYFDLTKEIERVVIGDHGAYLEINPSKITIELEIAKGQEYRTRGQLKDKVKYVHLNPIGFPDVKIYHQKKTVGYADYKPGMMYVSPDDIFQLLLPKPKITITSVSDMDKMVVLPKEPVEPKEIYLDKMEKRADEIEVSSIDSTAKNVGEGNFAHLHVHSEFSLLDGVSTLSGMCKRILEVGQKSIALTDHGVMFGNYEFQQEANKYGVKPIHGVEAYFVNNALESKAKQQRFNNHVILLAMNQTGWSNLCRIVSLSNKTRYYYKPRVDESLLSKYNEGIICLSGCYYSPISYYLGEEAYDPDRAKKNAEFFIKTFGDRFYNEIMNVGFEPYDSIHDRILNFAEDFKLKTVSTNDVHYLKRENAIDQDLLMKIQTGGKFTIEGDELFIKSREEMITGLLTAQMADMSLEIADRINFELKFDGYKFPSFDITKQADYNDFIQKQSRKS